MYDVRFHSLIRCFEAFSRTDPRKQNRISSLSHVYIVVYVVAHAYLERTTTPTTSLQPPHNTPHSLSRQTVLQSSCRLFYIIYGGWCGVLWCSVLWCDVLWCGVVWCVVVCCGVVCCGVVRCGVLWCGVVQCGVMAHREVQCSVVVQSLGGCFFSYAYCIYVQYYLSQTLGSCTANKIKYIRYICVYINHLLI